MFNEGYYNEDDLRTEGFKSIGKNVQIFKNCTIVGIKNISIGDNVRIDAYCSIFAIGTGYLKLGSYIHIGGYCLLSASDGIIMEDFSGLSQRVSIYSRTDDYSGEYLTNPTVPSAYSGGNHGTVVLKKHVIIGSGSVILPNLTIEEGASVGALSLVIKSLSPWGVYAGSPVKRIRDRSQNLLALEDKLREDN